MTSLDGVPDEEINAITHGNAMRHFRYDPFAQRSREQCTVGALRAQALDWDVAPKAAPTGAGERKHTRASDLLTPGIAGRR